MRSLIGDDLMAAVAAAVVVAAIEIAAMGFPAPWLSVTVLALFVALGLVAGAAMAAGSWVVERFELGPLPSAGIRASPALVVLVPVGSTLFEGGFAATLPGASWAPIGFPLVGVVVLAAALLVGDLLVSGRLWLPGRLAERLIAGALLALVVAAELANRNLYPTEYPRVHGMLVVVSVVALAMAIRMLLGAAPLPARSRRRARMITAAAGLALLGLVLPLGLDSTSDRWSVATRGNHARHLANTVRAVIDLDGDGYASVLGGGDCDDTDKSVNPGAHDLPVNGRDEDCDGVDARQLVRRPTNAELQAELAELRDSAEARRLRARLAEAELLIISVDALRADALAPTDDNRRAFPNLMKLMADSRRFTRAMAPSSGTDVSLSSMVTARVDPFVTVDTTLFEALQRSGRQTAAVIPTEVLRWAPKTLLSRGIERLRKVVNDRNQANIGDYTTSVETTDRALKLLEAAEPDKPLALWVHYFDVHEHKQIRVTDRNLREINEDLGSTERKYRALLRLTDREIGRLLDAFQRRGRPLVIVLLSDHGESLGEDSRLPDNHGLYVYRALTQIPLAIRVPGVHGAAIDELVSLIDLFPTLADLLALPEPDGAAGDSQFLHLLPSAPPAPHRPGRVLVLNESHQWGVIEWPYKLMVRPADNLTELYDLVLDPDERHNLAGAEPELVRRLKQLYHGFPRVSFDRSRAGRRWRERQARPPQLR